MSATEIRSMNKRSRNVDVDRSGNTVNLGSGIAANASSNSLSSVHSSKGGEGGSISSAPSSDSLVHSAPGSATETENLSPGVSISADGATSFTPAAHVPVASPSPTPSTQSSEAGVTEPTALVVANVLPAHGDIGNSNITNNTNTAAELEALNQECLELEEENAALKEEIKGVWGNYKGLQDRASAAEAELHALRLEHSVLLGEKENSAEEAKIKALTHRLEDGKAREAKLEADLQRLTEHSSELQEQVTDHYSVVSTLKNREEERVLALTQEHMRALKAAQAHARELENRCAALSTTNADLYKENHSLADKVALQNADAVMQAEYAALQSKHALLESQHYTLTTEYTQCELQLRLANGKLAEAEAQCQQFSREKNETLYNHGLKVKALEQELAKLRGNGSENEHAKGNGGSDVHPSTAVVNELQLQCSTLSQQIMKKQGVILELQAEKSTLKSRLNDYLKRIQELEAAAAQTADLEVFGGGSSNQHHQGAYSGGGYNSRGNSQPYQRAYNAQSSKTQNTLTNQLILLNILPKNVVNEDGGGLSSNMQFCLYALEGFDHYCYMFLRAIATSPLLRCVFVVYFLALHFWSFVIVIYHATVLDLDGNGIGTDGLNATSGMGGVVMPEAAAANVRKIAKVASGAYKNTVGPDGMIS